jgi:hypothetical protein
MSNLIRQRGDMLGQDRREVPPARRKMIHDHRKKADTYGPKLPFELGIFKPKVAGGPRNVEIECTSCGKSLFITKATCAIECPSCKTLWVK